MDYKTLQDLMQIVESQKILIDGQLQLITDLIKENAEKENFICELTKEVSGHET